jgi:hypothetical protein
MQYAVSVDNARTVVEPAHPQDLLAYYLARKAGGAEIAVKQWLDHQLAPYVHGTKSTAGAAEPVAGQPSRSRVSRAGRAAPG